MKHDAHESSGFSIVEILIVLSILTILATFLYPRLLAARDTAQEKAAQAYSSSVAKVLTAVLSSDSVLSAADVAAGTYNCGPGAPETTEIVVSGNTYAYGWQAAPLSVVFCDVTVSASGGVFDVEVQTLDNTYVNGVLH